jgi:hypothetical protein
MSFINEAYHLAFGRGIVPWYDIINAQSGLKTTET